MSGNINLRNTTEEQHLAVIKRENPDLKELIELYPPDMIDKLMANKKKLVKISSCLEKGLTKYASASSMLMRCTDHCIFRDICIFAKEDMAPYGHDCLVEKKVISELENDLVVSLKIDRNDPIEMEMLWDLIDTKLLDMRASGRLKDGSLVQVVEMNVGKASTTKEEVSPVLETKLEIKKLKHAIIDSFIGTRRAKKKYGMNNDTNALEQMILEAAKNASKK